jgi:CubicO group peptidase (beta-lactamase class C family)
MMRRFIRKGHEDRHWRKWLTGLALGVVILSGSAYGFAPHLSRLLIEGFPAAQWPASGDYAEIGGVLTPTELSRSGLTPDIWARELFEQYDGKALLVYHRGQLKLEHYASGVSAQTRFNSYSMAKSLVGALVLKAHADGLLHGLDDPIGRYLPAIANEAVSNRPIRSFLQMRSGLDFETGSKTVTTSLTKDKATIRYNPFGRLARLHMGGLEDVQNDLGINPAEIDQFKYQNINTALLGSLLETIYQRPLEQLLSEKIWQPAGAATASWRRYDAGKPVTPYCCIYATARDWLRVGRFLANNGTDEDPLLPLPLWRAFMGADVEKEDLRTNHYGDHIYHNILDRTGEPLQGRFTFMFGNGGQVVYLMPEKDLIIVRFGERVSLLHSTVYSAWRSINPQ